MHCLWGGDGYRWGAGAYGDLFCADLFESIVRIAKREAHDFIFCPIVCTHNRHPLNPDNNRLSQKSRRREQYTQCEATEQNQRHRYHSIFRTWDSRKRTSAALSVRASASCSSRRACSSARFFRSSSQRRFCISICISVSFSRRCSLRFIVGTRAHLHLDVIFCISQYLERCSRHRDSSRRALRIYVCILSSFSCPYMSFLCCNAPGRDRSILRLRA